MMHYSHSVVRSVGQTPSEPGCLPGRGRWCSPPSHTEHPVSPHPYTFPISESYNNHSQSAHHDLSSLLGQVADRGRGEVEVTGF